MVYVYAACAQHVTIISTGGKFQPVSNVMELHTLNYSGRPFLCALVPIIVNDTKCSHLNFNLCSSLLLLLLLPCKHLLHDVVFPCQEESHLLSLLGAVLRWSCLQQVQLSHFSTDSLGITFL